MPQQQFPCFGWSSTTPVSSKKMLAAFLSRRPDSQWVMVGQGCAQSAIQLWTAWQCASRRWTRSTSLANSLDAEFLRYLSGTHHVSEAFKRAGVNDGDTSGYLIWLPLVQPVDGPFTDLEVLPFDAELVQSEAVEFFNHLGVAVNSEPLQISSEGMQRLGFVFNESESCVNENALIGHILSADLNS
ncbi:MAG: hypothetical protein CMA63_04425 [Euryarchaeota archaeon]|nr:hypothetical protein [Euryarchaeota archaeon]